MTTKITPPKQWKTTNSLLGRKNTVQNKIIELNPPCVDIPAKFNEHFLKTHVFINEVYDYRSYLCAPPRFSRYLKPTYEAEIEKSTKTHFICYIHSSNTHN